MSKRHQRFENAFGFFPDNWEIGLFGDVADVIDPQPDHRTPPEKSDGEPYVGISDFLADGTIDWNKCRKVIPEALDKQQASFQIQQGNIIFGKIGTIGAPKYLPIMPFRYALSANVMLIQSHIPAHFVMSWLQSDLVAWQIQREMHTTSQPAFGITKMRDLLIPLPPLAEQRKIAAILSTWDEAIALVESLISALKTRKQGLMQRLLTGEVRFAGFDDEWQRIKAGAIFESFSKRNNGDEELLSVTQDQGVIPRSMLDTRVVMPDGSTESYKLVEPGDFIISLRSFQGGLEYSEYRGLVSPAYTVLKPKLPIDDSFYKYFFKSYEFIGRLAIAVIGIRDGKQISFRDFADMKLPYTEMEEQRIIGETLALADAVIEEYANFGEHLREQKKGLMQVLLTGQVRVGVGA